MAGTLGEEKDEKKGSEKQIIQRTYFDVLGLCCSSEVALVEKILNSLKGVKEVNVIVPSKTLIVKHDSLLISPSEIAKALNQAGLEANVRFNGKTSNRKKWPRPYVLACGVLLGLSFLRYVYDPLKWLAVVSVACGIWPILVRGAAAVKNLTLDVNILVIIAVGGTLALRDYWEAGTIVFLFAISEWLQSQASHKANAVMSSLMMIAPQKATIAETGESVNVEEVKPGTILAVKTGEVIPIDGLVVEGSCEVDEKALTGEAFPVAKQKDSTVLAGTINLNGGVAGNWHIARFLISISLVKGLIGHNLLVFRGKGYISVETTAFSTDCAVAKMASLVEEAQNKKPRFQRLIDEIAKYYTPAVVLLSAGFAVIPAAMRVHNLDHWFHLALVVLVSACPCGLILSTPVATFCALSKAASSGLLIKGGDYIETLCKVKTLAFDKTGTITRGEFLMTDFRCVANDVSIDTLLYWVSSIESKSSHPIADAVVSYCKSQSIEPKPDIVEDFQNFPGEGVSGKINGREIYVGNRKFSMRAGCLAVPDGKGRSEDGRTLGFVYCSGAVIGTFSLADTCRSGAINAIRDLKSMGIRTAMLTGDSNAAATYAHDQLERTLDDVHAELLPEDKARIIEQYKKSGPTAMVGDGVNDAPALATADVGISMGVSGSALATETGHVILMSNDIRLIPKAIKLAKRTRIKVIQNIVFSIATKAVILAVAFAGHPLVWLAVLADVLTCLLVILNSMMLLGRAHNHGSAKCGSHHHHHHGHSHGKKSGCDGTSASNHVHDHEGSCLTSGVHKCSSTNVATRRCKASPEEHAVSCRVKKCNVDPLVHHHQHVGCGVSEKLPECSSEECSVNGTVCVESDECCKSVKACEKERCRDLEGQARGCLGDECIEGAPSSKSASDCQHKVKCCGETRKADVGSECGNVKEASHAGECELVAECHRVVSGGHGGHDHHHHHHPVAHKHACVEMGSREVAGSCCKSFMEARHSHSHSHGHFAGGFGAGLTEIVSE